jgi:hypothetical protein
LKHKVSPLGSLEYKPRRLGVQAKRLKAQAVALEMHALGLKAQLLERLKYKLSNLRLKPPP